MKDLNKLFEILKKEREKKGYSLRQLQNILNSMDIKFSYSTLKKMESKEFNSINMELLTGLCKIYHLEYSDMLELVGGDKNLLKKQNPETVSLPVYSVVSQNDRILNFNITNERFVLFRNLKLHKESFLVEIIGKNMEPILLNKDKLLFEVLKKPEWRSLIDKIVVVEINSEKYIKIVKAKNYKPEYRSLNKLYPPIKPVESDEVNFIGVLVEVLERDVRNIKF